MIGFVIGILLSSTGWWIFRTYELSPILAERDCAPLILAGIIEKPAENIVRELDSNDPESIERARKYCLGLIDAFVKSYEELEKKHPVTKKYFGEDYKSAKEFLKKYKKPEQQLDALNSDSAAAKAE